ncbi:phage tail sheath subtilisin-like domain-containing protein [Lentzea sp. BCCO 10_0856]|uniref:Phage tail sheath subtilisin-like domain-containing protein n=1 Tax=Lentzea miocenica TaxID=3095431 RepID=A0ABU4STS0_9PSEU|nr:phage tail sheath subtilisin-like domain-containing protein [Lentzea sp. BCCO 10_0856]MDX8029284.1 phage tail sheath subtilisin-like domain-containing protein [Lentzea sp. BCCO 10_0856]
MRAVFLTFSGPHGRVRNAYEMWSFSGTEVLEGVLRDWFANGGGAAELVRLDGPDDLPAALEGMPDADVVCFPGLAEPGMNEDAQYWLDAQPQVVAECERRGSIAVLDSPPGLDPWQALDWRSHVLMIDSPNAVLYYPWIRAGDGWVPPCGHVAGAWARVTRDEGFMASVGGIELTDVVDVATDVAADEQWALQRVGMHRHDAVPLQVGGQPLGERSFALGPMAQEHAHARDHDAPAAELSRCARGCLLASRRLHRRGGGWLLDEPAAASPLRAVASVETGHPGQVAGRALDRRVHRPR